MDRGQRGLVHLGDTLVFCKLVKDHDLHLHPNDLRHIGTVFPSTVFANCWAWKTSLSTSTGCSTLIGQTFTGNNTHYPSRSLWLSLVEALGLHITPVHHIFIPWSKKAGLLCIRAYVKTRLKKSGDRVLLTYVGKVRQRRKDGGSIGGAVAPTYECLCRGSRYLERYISKTANRTEKWTHQFCSFFVYCFSIFATVKKIYFTPKMRKTETCLLWRPLSFSPLLTDCRQFK